MYLKDANVLITGGGGGIATAIARELLDAGAAVMLADRDPAALERAAVTLNAGDRVALVSADLTRSQDIDSLATAAARWGQGLDVLINAAGVNHFGLFDEQSSRQIEQAIAVNVLAPVRLIHALLPHLKSRPAASILNIGSAFGSIGYPGYAVYAATKFALRGFTEALRRELADTAVNCQLVAPRATRTGINSDAVEAMNVELGNQVDSPEVVAAVVRRTLEKDHGFVVLGWPEKLFARLNGIWPGLVESAIVKQLPTIKRYARRSEPGPKLVNDAKSNLSDGLRRQTS